MPLCPGANERWAGTRRPLAAPRPRPHFSHQPPPKDIHEAPHSRSRTERPLIRLDSEKDADTMEDPQAIKPRRSHNKSRLGCAQCKSKKVKV